MVTFYDSYVMAEQRAERQQEAAAYRLFREAVGKDRRGQAHQRIEQFLHKVGRSLIETGERLQTQADGAQG